MKGQLPFDVFIRRTEKAFTRILKTGEHVEVNRIKSYEGKKGVSFFFVHREKYEHYLEFVETLTREILLDPESANVNELSSVVNEMAGMALSDLASKQKIDPKAAEFTKMTVQGCVSLMNRDRTAMIRLIGAIGQKPYHLRHAMMTTVFSILLAQMAKLTGEKTFMTLGLGAMLHDIGMGLLSFDPDEIEGNLTQEQFKELKTHPEVGKGMADAYQSVPREASLIILQHHEQPNGYGYPNKTFGQNIYFPAKIVSIADGFADLVGKKPNRERAFTPIEAIEIMTQDRGKYDAKLLELWVSTFAKVRVGPKKAG